MSFKERMAALEQEMFRLHLTKDLVLQAWGYKKKFSSENSELNESDKAKFPYKVMYEDGTISWTPIEGKKPWGVFIREDECLCIHKAKTVHCQREAQEITERTLVGNYQASLPSIVLIYDIAGKEHDELHELFAFMELLGGTSPNDEEVWSNAKAAHDEDGWPQFLSLVVKENHAFVQEDRYDCIGIQMRPAILLKK